MKFFEFEIKKLMELHDRTVDASLDPEELTAANENLKNPSFYLKYV